MASGSVQMNGSADFVLTLTVTESATNAGANTSDVAYSLIINPPGNYEAWNLNTGDQSYSITINGAVVASGGFTYDFRSPNANVNKTIKASSVTGIAHLRDGSKTITATAAVNTANGGIGDGTVAAFNVVLTNFTRLPSTPGIQANSRTNNGGTVNVTSGTSTFYGSGGYYQWMWSYDNANWNGPYNLNGSRNGSASVAPTANVYVIVRAVDSEGVSGWSNSNLTVGIPTAPAAINATRTNRDITVTAGSSSGSGITGYFVQSSSNDGGSWSTAQAMAGQVYTYTSLTAGQTYLFRVYSANSVGTSDVTTAAVGVFVPAGGKRWDGSSWAATTTAKRWDGSAWVDILTAKRWTGSAWVDLS